jgi:uncharacterized protein YeeX (DUF496 family)
MIWGVLDDAFMDDREAVILSWLEQYIKGEMREKELLERVEEMRAEFRREWEEVWRNIRRREMVESVKSFFLKPIRYIKRLIRRRRLPF